MNRLKIFFQCGKTLLPELLDLRHLFPESCLPERFTDDLLAFYLANLQRQVIDFKGDLKASGVPSLRQEVNAILDVANDDDEVIVRLENHGGVVHEHGLAASQLVRIRDRDIPLIVCVDKVAASGGYMMACVADRILAAPFAILGSIDFVMGECDR